MRDDHFGSALGEIETWIWIAVGFGLLLFVGFGVAIIYWLLLAAKLQYEHKQRLLEAGSSFDAILAEHGDFEASHIANVVYGTATGGRGTQSIGELVFGVGVRADD